MRDYEKTAIYLPEHSDGALFVKIPGGTDLKDYEDPQLANQR